MWLLMCANELVGMLGSLIYYGAWRLSRREEWPRSSPPLPRIESRSLRWPPRSYLSFSPECRKLDDEPPVPLLLPPPTPPPLLLPLPLPAPPPRSRL